MSRLRDNIDPLTTLLTLFAVFVWGFSFIAIKVALRDINPGQLVILRFLPVLIVFGPVALFRLKAEKSKVSLRDIGMMLFLGFFGVIVYNLALNTGQTKIPASLAALVIALNPASIAIIASTFLKERPATATISGLVIGFLGIAVVIISRRMEMEIRLSMIHGVLITLGAPLSWGIYTAGLRFFTPRYGALTSTSVTMSLGSLPLIFFIDKQLISEITHASLSLIISVLFLSIFCSVLGFTIWAKVLGRIEASQAGAFIYLVPVVAAFGSHWLLDEPIDLPLLSGTAIVLIGVAVATGHMKTLLVYIGTKLRC